MFRSKTVFVLGAGSSHEVGLPIGDELKNEIASKIDIRFDDFGSRQVSGDQYIMQAIRKHTTHANGIPGDPNHYLVRAWQLRDALPLAISIDNLLDAHRGDEPAEMCGKLGIVRSILEAEQKSELYFKSLEDRTFNFKRSAKSWFSGFMKLLTESVPSADLGNIFANVCFVNFNYDRCVEHYLFHALQTYYAIDQATAVSVLGKLKVFHPYGQVGKLPWQQLGAEGVHFGAVKTPLLEIAKQIKTFNERVLSEDQTLEWRTAFQDAEVIVFLGFAFHRQNLELLAPKAACRASRVYATAFGMSVSDCEILASDLKALLRQDDIDAALDIRNDLKCAEVFREYWRSLTAGL